MRFGLRVAAFVLLFSVSVATALAQRNSERAGASSPSPARALKVLEAMIRHVRLVFENH